MKNNFLKILLVTEDVPAEVLGGAGKHAILLANTLIKQGQHVELIGRTVIGNNVQHYNNDFNGKLYRLIDMSNLGFKEVATGVYNPIKQLLFAWRIWSAIKQVDYKSFDVIHYHGHVVELGVFISRKLNYVHTLHDQGSECLTKIRFKDGTICNSISTWDCAGCIVKKPNIVQRIISSYSAWQHRYIARHVFTKHKSLFVSEFLLRNFKRYVSNSENINATVIHNFTDIQKLKKLSANMQLKPAYRLPKLLIVGRVDVAKGQRAFLEQVDSLILNKYEVLVVGDGPDLNDLKAKYVPLGIKFLGWKGQDEVYTLTMDSHICIIPSIWEEPFGTTILEALSLGKRVFALDYGGTAEMKAYIQYTNQLQLFDNMIDLVKALLNQEVHTNQLSISHTSDVHDRISDIITLYLKDKPHG